MHIYYMILVCLVMLSIGKPYTLTVRYVLAGILLFVVAALRGESVDRDYQGYIERYADAVYGDFWNIEPSFRLLATAVHYFFDDPFWLFLIYAGLGISIKLVAFKQLTNHKMTTLVVYFSGFFLLWEMTQIRVAVAGGIMLLSVAALRDRNAIKYFIFCSLASLFHYAALVMFLLYFINGSSINRLLYILLVPAAGLLLKASVDIVDLAGFAPIELVELKIRSYETYKDVSDNIYNYVFLARCLFAYFLLANADLLAGKNRYFVVLLKLYFLGLFCHLAFASVPAVSFRLGEFFLVVEVLLIPMQIDVFKSKPIGYFAAVMASLIFLMFSLHYQELLGPFYVSPAFT